MSEVLDFMKGQIGRVFSVREISKEVDSDRFNRDKTWASHELKGLCNKGLIEATNGCYWIPPEKIEDADPLEEALKEDEGAPLQTAPVPGPELE